MRLYSEVQSERVSRPAKKGGNEHIKVFLQRGNNMEYLIKFTEKSLIIYNKNGDVLHTIV